MPEWLRRFLPDGWTGMHLLWLSVGMFIVMLVGSLIVCAWVVVRIPADYFACHREGGMLNGKSPFLRWPLIILKNLMGVLLVLLGIALSLPGVPGQGVLTILLGVMLLDFPGKRSFERWLLTRRGVLKAVNKLRARYNKPPVYLEPVADCKREEEA